MAIMNQPRSPVPWMGGKHHSARIIIKHFPLPNSYDSYVELFGGGCSILIAKDPYRHVETVNDINGDLVNFWMQCRDNTEILEDRCRSLPYSREIYYKYHYSLFDGSELDPLERAVRWFYVMRSNFSAHLHPVPTGWSSGSKDRTAGAAHSYHSAIDLFKQVQKRFQRVMIDNRDFAEVFKQHDKSRTFFYCDPPYIDTEHYYNQPFAMQDHERLAALLNASPAYVALSYYPHPALDALYPVEKWCRVTWQTSKHSQKTKENKDTATELLLCNYPPAQTTLWDSADFDQPN